MANTYVSLMVHVVFSTKNREPWLVPPVRRKLLPYLAGIARENDIVASCIGGYTDHVHMLLSLPADKSVSRAVQAIKGGSSLWIHRTFPELRSFAWQAGYGAFSVGISQVAETRKYIGRQPEHHRRVSFQEEYLAFLKKNNIPYDERYLWI